MLTQWFRVQKHDLLALISIVVGFFLILRVLHPIDTPYDYYTRLASSLWAGNVCLPDNPPWLNELVFVEGLGYCVVYPLSPALFLLPFVAFFGAFSQTTGAHLIFALTGGIVFLLARKHGWSIIGAGCAAGIWCFATIFFSLSAVGSAWYIAQTMGAMGMLLALLVFNPQRHGSLLLSGICFGIAITARLPLHLAILYFLATIYAASPGALRRWGMGMFWFAIGVFPFFAAQRYYNYVRYQTVADQGYYLIPGKFEEADFRAGQFSLTNIPKHIKIALFGLPKISPTPPYVVPSHYGLSILFTSPFLVYGLYGLISGKRYLELLSIVAILLLEMSHGTVGFSQFGYRFALDIYPFLFLGLRKQMFEKQSAAVLFVVLVIFSVVVNLWGVLAYRNDWFVW